MAIIEEIPEEIQSSKDIPKEEKQIEPDQDGDIFYDSVDYQPEELQRLIKEATEYKTRGNTYFGQEEYKKAIEEYENALFVCPESLQKDRAIYFANIAACHLKQNEYKEARDMCVQALKLDPTYQKALLRKAQSNEKIDTYTSLNEALEDYKKLHKITKDPYSLRQCQRAEKELPIKAKIKMEKEKEEMLGKLKDLGNTLLGKFGLSTDNFQLQQDPNGSGGYSVNFVNNNNKQ
ncbi:uncharacterized protein BX663DRAFT_521029 [Cokeromyces recurvatus]|uniref:uncharacterized protein n=1 Tax=Cokeromyces recurvatus TaxID=90255 RepID=UPI002220DC3E|nr:uncharacterized protein BX663DRAFT_521029 [Cokeromyces recurvatus]KAI7899475.1 hypothetical protein BX663DRAFT_521029 [Cokeromyces recurvatus]